MRTRVIAGVMSFILMLGIVGCGSGGSSTSSAGKSKAVAAVSLAADQTVGGIQLTLNIPPGVTARTDAAGNAIGKVVEVVGGTSSANIQTSYTPATTSVKGTLTLVVIEPAGFTAGEFILVHLDITPGVSPNPLDLTIDELFISDLNGRTISISNLDYSVEII